MREQVADPLRWSAHRGAAHAPIWYTAPGGWTILHNPHPDAPDRPWTLHERGQWVTRCHTLLIAKLTAAAVAAERTRTP